VSPRLETLQESNWTEIELTNEQQAQLEAVGIRLAKGTDRYGNLVTDSGASLIKVERVSGSHARVRVLDAVGVVSVTGLQLLIEPKIPKAHLLFLAERSGALPAMAKQRVMLKEDQHLASLVTHWFVTALERLLEEGLSRDYRVERGRQDAVRGRLDPVQTARMLYRGQVGVYSEYEEFDFDTALNRLLLAAAQIVASGSSLTTGLRQRAARAIKCMDDVGLLRSSDMRAEVDRAAAHYRDGITLAKEVIRSSGRGLEASATMGWAFLFRTAAPVESGLRAILKEALAYETRVEKRTFPLGDSSKTVSPDLVFGDVEAIGDIKYKVRNDDWARADLYEVVAFAEAAGVSEAVLVDFQAPHSQLAQPLTFGKIGVNGVAWPADDSLPPALAAESFSAAARRWWSSVAREQVKMGAAGFEPATSRV
jgi:5-methylcytosine-specific restriction enzyme subunit McrC